MKIVSPPLWYMAFWLFAFLPAFGLTCYIVGRSLVPLYEAAQYRAHKRALEYIVELYGPLPLFHKGVGE